MDELRAHLEDVSVPALLGSCVTIGTPEQRREILDGQLRAAGSMLNEYQGYMAPDDLAAARDLAHRVITDWLRRGSPAPDPLSEAELVQTMNLMVAEEVGPEYVPMMLEELSLDGDDSRGTGPVPGAADVPVLIIGAGMSGLLAAVRVQQAGYPYVVVEKNDGVGGTWRENTYPGARVDVGSHFYAYSFEPSDHWTEYFAQQPELLAYFERVAEQREVDRHIRFGVEVVAATWDEPEQRWSVELDDGSTLTARAVISAVGLLSRPFVPDVPGTFDGPQWHTARWDHGVDLTDRDVVMVGAGATGFQVAPAIAERVRSLTVIQRTAQWMFPNPGYHDPVGPGQRWALEHLPGYARWFRFLIMFPGTDTGLAAAKIDPAWVDQDRSVSEVNDLVRTMFTEWIVSQVDGDPELVEKVVPPYRRPASARCRTTVRGCAPSRARTWTS